MCGFSSLSENTVNVIFTLADFRSVNRKFLHESVNDSRESFMGDAITVASPNFLFISTIASLSFPFYSNIITYV